MFRVRQHRHGCHPPARKLTSGLVPDQWRAALSANAEMIAMYWDMGRMIHQRQKEKGWGAGVIPRLAVDLKNEFPEVKGFSERNIKRMLTLFREYPELGIVPQFVAQWGGSENPIMKVPQPVTQLPEENDYPILQRLVAQIPWGDNILLMEKVRISLADNPTAEPVLGDQILKQNVHELVERVRKNTSIDWQLKESVQA